MIKLLLYGILYRGSTKNPNDETIGTGDDKIYLKKMNWDIYSLNNDGTENELINDSKENGKLNKDPRDFFENNKNI